MIDDDGHIIRPALGNVGCDLYISTSSAGGGLQMMVAGVVRSMTAESAERAALGAGSIVMDVIALNDKRLTHERIERIQSLRPDMILIAGETDGANTDKVIKITETIGAADPKPRLGSNFKLPVIFAGNKIRRDEVKTILEKKTDLNIVDNLRPTLEEERLFPAREKIHNLFLEHVMKQAPGYGKLMEWVNADIMPTPAAVGAILKRVATEKNINAVGVDIGGATTDIFSLFRGEFNRTVSANLGMSYSISNVLAESGLPNLIRWIPFDLDERDLRNRIKNKMIRPTTIPQTLEELILEQAIAKEALRLSFIHHRAFATRLKGVQQQRTISDSFDQDTDSQSTIEMMDLNLLVASGGVLSHAPQPEQTAMMLIDAFLPEGITQLAKDSIFMMPHLGVLAQIHPQAATEVFENDCLIYLGTCIAPRGIAKNGRKALSFSIQTPDGKVENDILKVGEMKRIKLDIDSEAKLNLDPSSEFDVGQGKGVPLNVSVKGGSVGIIFDCRGRPLSLPKISDERINQLKVWFRTLAVYPEEAERI